MTFSQLYDPRLICAVSATVLLSACGGGAEPLRPAGRPAQGVEQANPAAAPVVTPVPVAAGAVPPAAAPGQPPASQNAALVRQYQELLVEMRELRDVVEQQQFDLESLRKAYGEEMQSMRERLAVQEARVSGRLPSQANTRLGTQNSYAYNNTRPTTDVTVSPAPATRGTPVNPPVTSDAPTQTPTPPTTTTTVTLQPIPNNLPPSPTGQQPANPQPLPPVAAVATSAAGQDQYDAAFELLKQSRYEEAIAEFEAFIKDHGNTDLADDAQYWVGEANYVTRDFDAAIGGFRSVVTKYPTSSRAGDALLKVGYIQYEKGEYVEARNTFNQVVTQYPGSRVANSAAARLQQMTQEGR